MKPPSYAKVAGVVALFVAIVLSGMSVKPPRAHADDDDTESRIKIGFAIAPVPLNLAGKNRALVGLGSYIVNAQADCNGCHSAGPPTEFAPGGNPYFGQPTQINPATYLGGGRDFGPFPGPGPFPHIISRNLTPDKTGAPDGTCLPHPFDGSLLQIMPWPIYHNMTDRDLRAIYEYLSAIPCIAGPPAPDPRHNDCE